MNLKLIETLLIALLPLFAATSAAQVSAAGPMLRNLEEGAVAMGTGGGGKTCSADEDTLVVEVGVTRLANKFLQEAGVIGEAFNPTLDFTDPQKAALKVVAGNKIWGCIEESCGPDITVLCLREALTIYVEALYESVQGQYNDDGFPMLYVLISRFFLAVPLAVALTPVP